MPWEVPITVGDNEFRVKFEGDAEPTEADIAAAVEHLKDPARGQTASEGMGENLKQGFGKGLVSTFLTGPGAVAEALGFEDNAALREGRRLEKEIEAAAPVSQENQEKWGVKAFGAMGQMTSMVVTAPLAGAGAVKGASVLANFFARTRQLAMMGGFQGAAAGEEEAVRLGITDPLSKAAMIMGYGLAEATSEKLGGYGVETGLMRVLRGDLPVGQFGKRVVTGGTVEGLEEVGAGVPQRAISKALAQEDPNRPGFTPEGQPIHNPWDVGMMLEEWSLGATAGGTMVGVTNVFNNLSPQQQQDSKNVAHLPGPLRESTYKGIQATRAKGAAAQSMVAGLDEATKSAMRLATDGGVEKLLADANKQAATEFAEGWQEREKANLTYRGEEADVFFQDGQWVVLAGQNEAGQPVWAPAPNAAELEKARKEWVQTGEMPEQMQPLTELDDGITPEMIQGAATELPTATPEEIEAAIADLQSLPPSSGVVKMLAMLEAEKARRPASVTPVTPNVTPAAAAPATGSAPSEELSADEHRRYIELLDKRVAGTITPEEAAELRPLEGRNNRAVNASVNAPAESVPATPVADVTKNGAAPLTDEQMPDLVKWDQANRHRQGDEWFDGAKVSEGARQGFAEALQAGGDQVQAHGMSKEGTLTGAMRKLAKLLQENVDPKRGRGALDTAGLVSSNAMASGGATASGAAYNDGPFMLLQKPGEGGGISDVSQIAAVLVNEAHADLVPQIEAIIHGIRPDIIVAPYSKAGEVVKALKATPARAAAPAATEAAKPVEQSGEGLVVPDPVVVAQVYPNSPDLVERLKNAESPAAAVVIMQQGEPEAQLREELAKETPIQVADRLREAGYDESVVDTVTAGPQVLLHSAAKLLANPPAAAGTTQNVSGEAQLTGKREEGTPQLTENVSTPAESSPETGEKVTETTENVTERFQPDEFEARLREKIREHNLTGWTNVAIERAVEYHRTHNRADLPFAKAREMVEDIEREMQTPGEQRQSAAAARKGAVQIAWDKVKALMAAVDPARPEGGIPTTAQEELDSLPENTGAQDFIDGIAPRVMDWAMRTQRQAKNYAAFLKAGVTEFGARFKNFAQRLWTAVQVMIVGAVGFTGTTSQQADALAMAAAPIDPAPIAKVAIIQPNVTALPAAEPVRIDPKEIDSFVPTTQPEAGFSPVTQPPAPQTPTQRLAAWILGTSDNKGAPFVVADKTAGTLTMYDGSGRAVRTVPALFGKDTGDVRTPGSTITPSGKFGVNPDDIGTYVDEHGENEQMGRAIDFAEGADSIVAIHRLYLGTPTEQRPQRLATSDPRDNRVSQGCINLDEQTMERDLLPLFEEGGYVYVLPETAAGRATFKGFRQAVRWADRVVSQGNINAGLNPTLLAAHAIRSADWIMTNGRNFAKWAQEQISRFGDAIRGSLRRIWSAATELLRTADKLPPLTPADEAVTIPADEPANRPQRSESPEGRRIGSVAATVARIGEASGVELATHSETNTPVISVIHGDGGTTVSVHEQYAAAVAALNGSGRVEELTKLASFLALQRAISGAAVRPVPSWLAGTTTRQELLMAEVATALSGTGIDIRDLWTVGLEIMMGRPFESSSQRDAALLGLRADLAADPQSAEGWFSHLLRLAAERQAGQLSEQRGGLFEAAPQWRQRVLKTLDSFLGHARGGQYGQDVQNVLQLAAGTYQDAAVATATAMIEGELINRQIQRDTDQEIHTTGDVDLGARAVSPYRESIRQAAEAMGAEVDVRFVLSAREAPNVSAIVQGAPFGIDADGTAVVALDQIHVTLNDRRRAEKAGTTAGEQALRRVLRDAQAAAYVDVLDPRQELARAMSGEVLNAMQSNSGWAPFVDALWNEYGPELQSMVAGSTTEARGEQARTDSPSYDGQQRATRVRDRNQAATVWLSDNYGRAMEQTLLGYREISQPLTSLTSRFARATEDFVRESLQPHMTGVPVRYSARRPNLRVRMTRGDIVESIEGSSDWKDWYERHDQTLRDLFGEDADLFQLLLSATSQAASVKTNVSLALKAYSQLKEGKPFEGYLPAVIKNLDRIREGTKLSGQKISAYQEASTDDEKKVVVDRHIARMLFRVDSPSPAQFAKAAKVLTEIGDQIGWTPRQVQAALWAASIRKAGNTPESYDSYLARLKSDGTFDQRVGRFIPASRDITPDGGVGGLSLGQGAGNAEAGNGEGLGARVVRNSAQARQPIVVARKVGTAAAERARLGLLSIAPTAGGAWIGTRAQVNAHLLSSPQARNAWELGWRLSAENANATKAQADQAFRDWVDFGLDQMEGFSLGGRTYLIADQTFVYDTDGTEEMAARRVLLHEDAHETLQHLRDVDPDFDAQWVAFRNQVPASELDDLALQYPWMSDWRSSPSSHDDIFHEWIAHKAAEVEYRGMPSSDSLIGQIMQWLKTVWQSIVGANRPPSDQQILSFLDASRAAKWQAVRSTAGFRYSANKDGDTSARQTVDGDINGGSESGASLEAQQRYANDQVLGQIMGTTHAVQHLAPMRQFARFWLGGAHGDRAPVNPENTETAKELAQELLGGREFAADYIANFQEWYEETNPDAVPHAGDAAVAMLQIELMDYAARLAAEGDPSLMLRLLPTANQAHVGDVNTVEGSARVLQARSATTQNVIYDVLMDFMAGAARAAAGVDKLGSAVATVGDNGKVELGPLAASVDPTLNPDLARDVAIGMDEYADSDVVDSDAVEFDKQAEEFEPEAWRERARELLDPEFRKMDIRLETVMIRLAELQTFRESLKAKAASGAKASIAVEDRQRFATDPAALDAEIAALTAEATELLSRLSKPSTSHETKGKRKARVNNPKVAAAKKLLSADEKAKRFLERYESRNKRVRRDKEQWEKVLEDQVRNPVDEDMFRANAVEAGVEVETADKIFEVAEQIRAERRAKMKPKAAKPDRTAEKAKKDLERYYASIERAEGKEAAVQAKLATQRQKAQVKAENKAIAGAQQQARKDAAAEARDAAKKAEKAARELNKFQNEAEAIIDGLATQFSDTPTWKKSNPSQLRELRRQYRERVITRGQFVAGATALNVTDATANQLADLTEEEQRRQDVVAEARERAAEEERLNKSTAPSTPSTKIAPPRLSYRDLIGFVGKALVATPLSQQSDPKWVEETFISAFQDMGFPRDVAQRYAAKIAPRYASILQAAQLKQMEKSAKTLNVKKITQERVGNWIRSGVFNPMVANPVVAALMKEAGYAQMSEADFKTLAELDDAINSGFATLSAEAFTKIQRILRQLRPHKHWNPLKEGSVWAQLFVNGALSSLGVTSLNWLHTAYILPRRLVTDLGAMLGDTMVGAGKGGRAENLKLMANMFGNLWAARENFLNQAIHSLSTDSYKGRMLEMLNTEHELYTELMKAIEDVKSGSASERLLAIPKIAWLSSDWVRRMLASADQTWGSVIQRYVIRNEAMRMMVQDAGLTVEAAALVVQQAVEAGAAMSSNLEAAGMDARRAALIGEDQMIKTLRTRMDEVVPTPAGKPSAGTLLITMMEKESATELGNRRGEMSPGWDIPNVLLEGFKSAASAVRKQSELIGRPLTGFVSVGANLLNRSFYFTPLGALRVLAKRNMNEADRQKFYGETMATAGQMRARLYESIAGTIMLMVLEIFRWRPEDKEWGVEVTGNGPQTPALREAWYKGGNKKGSIQLKDGQGNVLFSVSYIRGGLDHMAIPLTFAGAHSDMDLEGKSATPKDVNWAWAYTQTVGGNIIKSAQFFGAKAVFGGMPTSTKPHALAGMVAYQVQPFLPWGGLQRSTWKMLSGPTDEGSWRAAVASNIPIAQVFLGTPKPAINFLGDQLGNEPTEDWKKMLDRGAGQGFPPFLVAMDPTPENERIYDFLMTKGVAPTTPLRSYLENKNGFLTDEKWYSYVQYRGALIKAAITRDMSRLNKLRGRDLEKEISRISSDATKATKEKMGFE